MLNPRPPCGNLLFLATAALLLALPYVPTLASPFDFSDDGCLVYPSPGSVSANIWTKTVWEFHHRGPFRPVIWARWEGAAVLFGPTPLPHRLVHLACAVLTAGLLLWLLLELSIPRLPAFATAAVSLWVPMRNEVWLGLGLTEAFLMPFALLALVAAVRAARTNRPWGWDLAAWTCALLAIGGKNTFAAIVPAQMYLRIVGSGLPWAESWPRGRWRALLLATTLLLPIVHFVAYKLDPVPKEYLTQMFGLDHVAAWLHALVRAAGLEFIGVALGLLTVAIWLRRRQENRAQAMAIASRFQAPEGGLSRWHILAAAGLLTACGVAIYLPIPGIAGRYTIPAVWGLDLTLAVVLTLAAECPDTFWKRAGTWALAAGLLVAVGGNVRRQVRYSSRSEMLWQAVHHLEGQVERSASLVWCGVPLPRRGELSLCEGTHFRWHLENRGRNACTVTVTGVPTAETLASASHVLTSTADPPAVGSWVLLRTFATHSWIAGMQQRCCLWHRQVLAE